MSFSLSGSTITQSGTDASLSGLSSISGVTTTTLPTTNGITIYNIGGLTLSVTGALTFDGSANCILSTNSKVLTVSGTLTVNCLTTVNGFSTYGQQYWLMGSAINNTATGGYAPEYAIIHVTSTGSLYWNGGYVSKAGSLVFDAGSLIRINSGGWNCRGHFATYPDQVRQSTSDIQVTGFRFLNGGSWTDMVKPITDTFGGFEFEHAYGFGLSGGQYDGAFHEYRDYSSINELGAGGFWSDVWQSFINPANGSSMKVIGFSATSSTSNVGVWQAVKEVKFSINADNVQTSGTKVWIQDNDDGFRLNWTKSFGVIDYVSDREYLETTSATSGNSSETGVVSVLLASAVRETGGTSGTNDSGLNKKSYRGKNLDTTDVFEARYCGYLTQVKSSDITLKGNGVLNVSDKLFIDQNISEDDKSIVALYDSIDSAEKFYDRAKLYLVDNYAGETDVIVARQGSLVNTGDFNVIVSTTVSPSFDVSGSTITINATNFSGSIETTGYVELPGTGEFNGTIVGGSVKIPEAGEYNFSIKNSELQMSPDGEGTYNLRSCGMEGTISLVNTTSHAIIVQVPYSATVITSDNTGGTISIDKSAPVNISAPNLLSGSRVRLYNVTDNVEIYNDVLSSEGINYSFSWTENKTIEMTVTYQSGTTAKLPLKVTGVVTSSGLTFLDTQEDDDVYNALAVDGSTVTGFEPDYIDRLFVVTSGAPYLWSNAYAWWVYNLTTADGIRNFIGGITAFDVGNFRINVDVVDMFLDNSTAENIYQMDNRRVYRSDGAYPVLNPTTGGGGIDVNWRDQVLLVQSDDIATIKAATSLIAALM